MKSLYLCENCCYSSPWIRSFNMRRYKNLNRIHVGSDSFYHVNHFELRGLNHLESAIFDQGSFRYARGTIIIEKCPKLQVLSFGTGQWSWYGSVFYDVYSLTIRNLDSLESFTVYYGFRNVYSFTMESSYLTIVQS